MSLRSGLALAAVAFLLAGAGGAAVAHPHPDGEGGTVKRFVIIEDGKGDQDHSAGERIRRFEIIRDGEAHASGDGAELRRFEMRGGTLVDCSGGDKIVDETADEGDKKTKVIICTKGQGSAMTAERIEKALERIRDSELSDEQKARIETALRSAIDRARSAR